MKEKLKNINFKHLFIVLLITLVIGFCVLAICLLNKYDENRSKTILNKYDDDITLNSNYHIDNNGNLVSNNLLNPDNIYSQGQYFYNGYTIGYDTDYNIYLVSLSAGTYTLSVPSTSWTSIVYDNGGGSILSWSNASNVRTFTTNGSNPVLISLYERGVGSSTMLNSGSSALPYEPFGTWYSNVSTINENNNTLSNYNSAIFYYNNSKIYTTTNLRLSYNVNYGFTFLDLFDGEEFTNLDYIELLYDTITINDSLLYVLTNGVGASAHIVFYNNLTSVLDFNYPYVVNDTNTSDDLPFPIEISGSYTFNKVRVYNLRPNGDYGINFNSLYLNSSSASYNYLLGFQDGYNRGIEDSSSSSNALINLQNEYNSLDANYQTLLEQYNTLLNQTDYSFSELFWSISAVPFGVLTSAFNINVLGVNLALNNYRFVYCYVVNLVI